MISFMASGSFANISATIGVSMVPGHTALMRIPREAYSSAALFVRPMTPCLDAWYVARPGIAIRPPIEEQLTTAALPRSRIGGRWYFTLLQTPGRLTDIPRADSQPLAARLSSPAQR